MLEKLNQNVINNSCKLINGSINVIGSEVECAGERFYVIPQDTKHHDSDSTTVSLLAKYNLNVGYNIYPKAPEGIQNENVVGQKEGYTLYGGDQFGGAYWSKENTTDDQLKSEYGSSYPAFVYDSNSYIYNYIEGYKNYLSINGINGIKEATVMSYEQYNYIVNNVSNYDWLYNTTYYFYVFV